MFYSKETTVYEIKQIKENLWRVTSTKGDNYLFSTWKEKSKFVGKLLSNGYTEGFSK